MVIDIKIEKYPLLFLSQEVSIEGKVNGFPFKMAAHRGKDGTICYTFSAYKKDVSTFDYNNVGYSLELDYGNAEGVDMHILLKLLNGQCERFVKYIDGSLSREERYFQNGFDSLNDLYDNAVDAAGNTVIARPLPTTNRCEANPRPSC